MPNLAEHVHNVAGSGPNCECVPFGFDPEFFATSDPIPAEIEQRIPSDKFVVGYAGSLGTTNALEMTMACVKDMQADNRFFFLFVGKGDLLDRLIAETTGMENVAFVGRLERAQFRTY